MTDTITGGGEDTIAPENAAPFNGAPATDNPATPSDMADTDEGGGGSNVARMARDVALILAVAAMIAVLAWLVRVQIFLDDDQFKIDAAAVPIGAVVQEGGVSSKSWHISGTVTDDGELAPESHVMVVLRDNAGNQFPAEYDATDGKSPLKSNNCSTPRFRRPQPWMSSRSVRGDKPSRSGRAPLRWSCICPA